MIFFADENISPSAARMLDIFDQKHQVRHHSNFFKAGTPDSEWLTSIASWEDDVIVLCADGRILTNKVQKQVLKECGLMFVYLSRGWTNLEWADIAWKIIKIWPKIVQSVEEARQPMVFEVPVSALKVRSFGPIRNL
jgi:hypothetical protein